MRVIVVGATGKTGHHVLRAGLGAGHHVTAFGRSVERLDIDDQALEVHKGDVFNPGAVEAAVQGHDAAIVCLGSTGLRDNPAPRSDVRGRGRRKLGADFSNLTVLFRTLLPLGSTEPTRRAPSSISSPTLPIVANRSQ